MALKVLVFACLVALAASAPTEPEQLVTVPPPTTTTTTSVATSPAEQAPVNQSAASQDVANTTATASMAVGSASEQSKLSNSTFSCYGRNTGYYADTDLDCRVYHFCLPGDFNGEQALDCVVAAKITAPCAESPKHYEASNNVLRKALVGHQVTGDNSTTTSSSTTPPPTSS